MSEHLPDSGDYDSADDLSRSIEFAYRHIRERVARGGPGWRDWPASEHSHGVCDSVSVSVGTIGVLPAVASGIGTFGSRAPSHAPIAEIEAGHA
jgi:hypothetical protein